jgi:hypothetical protein
MEWRRQRAVAKKRDRLDRQEKATEWELFLDTAIAEGYSWDNETHRAIIISAWLLKQGEEIDLGDDGDDMESEHKDLTF